MNNTTNILNNMNSNTTNTLPNNSMIPGNASTLNEPLISSMTTPVMIQQQQPLLVNPTNTNQPIIQPVARYSTFQTPNKNQLVVQPPSAVSSNALLLEATTSPSNDQTVRKPTTNYPYYSTNSADIVPQGNPQTTAINTAIDQQGFNGVHVTINDHVPLVNNDQVVAADNVTNILQPSASSSIQMVFSCKHCRSIFIDTNALVYHNDEFGIISFYNVQGIDVRENVQIAPNDRFDAGSNYYPIFCKLCQSLVGKKYIMSDRAPIVDILHLYTLDMDNLLLAF